MEKWVIYKITNPEGRIYIGRTSDLHRRIRYHFNPSQWRNKFLVESTQKFGKEAHSIEIIDSFEGTEGFANGKEIFWIRTHMSNINKWPEGNGMNLTDGGKALKGYKFDKEVVKKRNSWKLGTPNKPHVIEITRNRYLGKKFSPQHIQNIIKAQQIPVLQYDMQGNFLNEYISLKEAAKSINTSAASHIAEVCRGKRFMYKGFIWKFKQQKDV